MKKILFIALLLSLFLSGCAATKNNPINPPEDTGNTGPQDSKTACTQEAKLCPDGSSVGRTGQSCEFAPCPTEATKATSTGLANPASTYCVEHGGQSNIVTDPDGSQRGECVLPGGQTCDEWEYMRGTCK